MRILTISNINAAATSDVSNWLINAPAGSAKLALNTVDVPDLGTWVARATEFAPDIILAGGMVQATTRDAAISVLTALPDVPLVLLPEGSSNANSLQAASGLFATADAHAAPACLATSGQLTTLNAFAPINVLYPITNYAALSPNITAKFSFGMIWPTNISGITHTSGPGSSACIIPVAHTGAATWIGSRHVALIRLAGCRSTSEVFAAFLSATMSALLDTYVSIPATDGTNPLASVQAIANDALGYRLGEYTGPSPARIPRVFSPTAVGGRTPSVRLILPTSEANSTVVSL